MAKLLMVVGIIWAVIGALNIVGMFGGVGVSEGVATFGLILNMILFILPGLAVAGIGKGIAQRGAPAAPRTALIPGERKLCLFCMAAIPQDATVCHHCGRDVPGALPQLRRRELLPPLHPEGSRLPEPPTPQPLPPEPEQEPEPRGWFYGSGDDQN